MLFISPYMIYFFISLNPFIARFTCNFCWVKFGKNRWKYRLKELQVLIEYGKNLLRDVLNSIAPRSLKKLLDWLKWQMHKKNVKSFYILDQKNLDFRLSDQPVLLSDILTWSNQSKQTDLLRYGVCVHPKKIS